MDTTPKVITKNQRGTRERGAAVGGWEEVQKNARPSVKIGGARDDGGADSEGGARPQTEGREASLRCGS